MLRSVSVTRPVRESLRGQRGHGRAIRPRGPQGPCDGLEALHALFPTWSEPDSSRLDRTHWSTLDALIQTLRPEEIWASETLVALAAWELDAVSGRDPGQVSGQVLAALMTQGLKQGLDDALAPAHVHAGRGTTVDLGLGWALTLASVEVDREIGLRPDPAAAPTELAPGSVVMSLHGRGTERAEVAFAPLDRQEVTLFGIGPRGLVALDTAWDSRSATATAELDSQLWAVGAASAGRGR